jgi:glycosyltransferase involved in cell wall biosynthesis
MQPNYPKLQQPKISVVICNFNYEKYVLNAIQSVLNQTYVPHEIIVVDDGSTDASINKIQTLGDKIKLVTKKNGGQISAYNEGFNHITGDVVIFLDSDDELIENTLYQISHYFDKNVVKVHYKMMIIDSLGNDLKTILPSTLDSGDCAKDLVNHGLMYKSPPASGNAYRVSALKEIFPLPSLTFEKHSADYFCIYGVALLGNITAINQPLFKYRVHGNTKSQFSFGNALNNYDIQTAAEVRWQIFKKWIDENQRINLQLPNQFHDFTFQKLFYANAILDAKSFKEKTIAFKTHFSWISKAILLRNDFTYLHKAILIIWVVLCYLMPKSIAKILIQKVCNPIKS